MSHTNFSTRLFLAVLAAICLPLIAHAPASLASTPPKELSVLQEGAAYRLMYTGRAERIFLFFKIYEIAHYAVEDDKLTPPLSFDNILTDARPKAILVRFDRRLARDRIREELAKSLRRNAQDDWLITAQESINAFMAAIDRDANANDELIFYWLPGDRVSVEFNGEVAFETIDRAFAQLIWSIWFGAEPACEREGLLATAQTTMSAAGDS